MKMTPQEMKSRISANPFYDSWDMPKEYGGGVCQTKEEAVINYDGLTDPEKMLTLVYAWNQTDICPSKTTISKELGWSKYKVAKTFKELKSHGLECVATFSERTGMLCGRGYLLNLQITDK